MKNLLLQSPISFLLVIFSTLSSPFPNSVYFSLLPSLSVSLFVCLSHHLCFSHSLSMSLCLYVSLFLLLFLSLCRIFSFPVLSFPVPFPLSVCICLSTCLPLLSDSLSTSFFLLLSLSLFLSVSLSISITDIVPVLEIVGRELLLCLFMCFYRECYNVFCDNYGTVCCQ